MNGNVDKGDALWRSTGFHINMGILTASGTGEVGLG